MRLNYFNIFVSAAIVLVGANAGQAQSDRPKPTQAQATEMMRVVNDALSKNGFETFRATAMAVTSVRPAAVGGTANEAAGAAKTGTVPPPPCTVIMETPFGTLTFC